MDTFKELMEIIKRLKTRIRNLESIEGGGDEGDFHFIRLEEQGISEDWYEGE